MLRRQAAREARIRDGVAHTRFFLHSPVHSAACAEHRFYSTHVPSPFVCYDDACVQVFATVHDFYVNYLRNPFSPLGKPVDSDRFRLAVDRQINDYNS